MNPEWGELRMVGKSNAIVTEGPIWGGSLTFFVVPWFGIPAQSSAEANVTATEVSCLSVCLFFDGEEDGFTSFAEQQQLLRQSSAVVQGQPCPAQGKSAAAATILDSGVIQSTIVKADPVEIKKCHPATTNRMKRRHRPGFGNDMKASLA